MPKMIPVLSERTDRRSCGGSVVSAFGRLGVVFVETTPSSALA